LKPGFGTEKKHNLSIDIDPVNTKPEESMLADDSVTSTLIKKKAKVKRSDLTVSNTTRSKSVNPTFKK
jgi:hypothetical protein